MPSPKYLINPATGERTRSVRDQVVSVFGFAGVHQLAEVFEPYWSGREPSQRRGRRAMYSPTLLLAVLVAARSSGSLASLLRMLKTEAGLWQECREAFMAAAADNVPGVPLAPPTRDAVVFFRDRVSGDPELMGIVQARFQQLAVGQARHMGNLVRGVGPDWARPDERHVIYGDGTVIKPFSDVWELNDPIAGTTVAVGSRAQSLATARIQRVLSDMSHDEKHARGINMVSMHTWTEWGRIVLATTVAMEAEMHAALELVDAIAAHAGDGVHTLLYDGAISGWNVDYLMARHRIQTINKGIAASKGVDPLSRKRRVEHLLEEYKHAETESSRTRRRREQRYSVYRQMSTSRVAQIAVSRGGMPLGVSIYPKGNGLEPVYSRSHVLPAAVHYPDGRVCRHRLAIDDGALFELGEDEHDGNLVKQRLLACRSSVPFQRPDGTWGRRSTWTIECEKGPFDYEHEWKPPPDRHKADRPSRTVARDRDLRPLSRSDDLAAWYDGQAKSLYDLPPTDQRRFTSVFSRRNDAESFNNWYQDRLPHKSRAASLDPNNQALDFLAAAVLNNSNTWVKYHEMKPAVLT
ncbi:hypothetical protein [Mumia sp. DW29H23]|uniref:hypothetical protein n=1 Tax=Mumia sp. DW29H23 TaxID=3421241 RepID=UPI003D69323F